MDRSRVFRLAAALCAAAGLSSCMEAPKNDGRMFQRWAQAISEIPVTDEAALARAGGRTAPPAKAAPAERPGLEFTAEAAGLRAPIRIAVVDPLEMPNSRDLNLRSVIATAAPAAARLQPASMTSAPREAASAMRGSHAARIAAFRSRADAEAQWNALRERHPAVFAGVTPQFEPVDLGAKGTWVRLKAAGLPSPEAAARVCQAAGVSDPWCAKG